MNKTKSLSLTLGPVLFNWQLEKWRDFYYRIADEAPIDLVVLGEIVCSKRAPFFTPLIPDVLERLKSGGKTVILGSPILVMNKRERSAVRELSEVGYPVEANDTTALQSLQDGPFTVGPFINIYNEATRVFFEKAGATRISLNGELPLTSIKAITNGASVPIEVFAFGRMPLAISARCYHARSYGLTKYSCQYVCAKDTQGMDVGTIAGQPFVTVNGVQTLSHTVHSAISDIDTLRGAGVSALRLSPQDCDMIKVTTLFHQVLAGHIDKEKAVIELQGLVGGIPMSNGFLHGIEGFRRSEPLSSPEIMV